MRKYILYNPDVASFKYHSTSEMDSNFTVMAESIGDEYHTMKELYEHRYELFLALVKIYDNYITPLGREVKCWKSKFHDDGTMFDNSFILGIRAVKVAWLADIDPSVINITYHLPLKYWDRANVIELDKAPKWDGYTSKDVLERLRLL